MKAELLELISKNCEKSLEDSLQSVLPLKNQCILVTGAAGFMGKWITEIVAFLNDHHKFNINLILLSKDFSLYKTDVPQLAKRKDFTFIEKNVRDVIELPEEIEWIIHAAGNPDNREHSSDPLKTIDTIVTGTREILSASSRLSSLRKFINVSSGLVNGAPSVETQAISESYYGKLDCSQVSSCYAEAKRMAETLCAVYRNQNRLPILNVRPFSFIGPYQKFDKPWAINNFIRDSLLGGPIRILGNEETIRSYMYPSDMAVWLLCILANGRVGSNYNLGSPTPISLKKLAEKITTHFPSAPKIISGSSNETQNVSRFVPDVSKEEQMLNLKIKIDLDEAIKFTLTCNKIFL